MHPSDASPPAASEAVTERRATSAPAPDRRSQPARLGLVARARGRSGGAGPLFVLCLVLTFANFAAWAWATPLYAAPDAPTQVLHAAAAVRGQVVGTKVTSPTGALTGISVPKVFATSWPSVSCYAFHPTVTPTCAKPIPTSTTPVQITTYVGRYPPLYYLVVGLPSLAFVSNTGVYLMRLASALVNALLVSLALLAVARWSRHTLLLVGVMVAATPMAWFLGGMVNPSGFEICAAICLWTAGLVLVLEHADHPPPGLVAIVAVATGLFLLARPISPLWVAITYVVLCLLGGWRAVMGVLKSRAARWAALPLAGCAAFALWWITAEHALDLTPVHPVASGEPSLQVLSTVAGHTGMWLQQMVGVFGWLDTPAPLFTYVVWAAVACVVVLVAVARPGLRRSLALLLLIACVFAVPIALTYAEARRLGLNGQGRYWLPIAVGVPLVALALIGRSPRMERRWLRTSVVAVLSLLVGAADIGAFLEALRRYAVGVRGPLDFLGGAWHPPLGLLAAAVGGSAAVVVLVVVVIAASQRRAAPAVGRAGVLRMAR